MLPFYWKDINYNVATIGVILLVFMLAGALGVVLSPVAEKKFGVKNVFYISLISVLPLGLIFYFGNYERRGINRSSKE